MAKMSAIERPHRKCKMVLSEEENAAIQSALMGGWISFGSSNEPRVFALEPENLPEQAHPTGFLNSEFELDFGVICDNNPNQIRTVSDLVLAYFRLETEWTPFEDNLSTNSQLDDTI